MPLEHFSLEGRVCLFTGGAGHVVGAFVDDFARQGAICISCDVRPEKLDAQKSRLADEGARIDTYALDVTSEAEWEALLASVAARYGRVDGLVNGAGINAASGFLELDTEAFRRILDVNLVGTMLGCKVIGRHMVDRQSGSIVNISSASADPPLSRAFAYSASKAGVTNLTKNVAREFGETGVRVNALRPGFFPTEWNRQNFLSPERIASIHTHTPMRRFGEPAELVGAVQWLLSDASGFVTGAEIVVDGGFSCQTI
jgi:NAD(P)-dependent dehydrogenase (short-subunit alcohol dehydrogenase family)